MTLKIFVAHRLNYADEMYYDVCVAIDDAHRRGLLPRWTDLSLKPTVDYLNPDGSRKSDVALSRLAAVRVRDSDVVVVVQRRAVLYGSFLKKELAIACSRNKPIVWLADAHGSPPVSVPRSLGFTGTVVPWDVGKIARAIRQSAKASGRRR